MTMKKPRLRRSLAVVLADPRWKAFACGRATPEEIAELRAWAQENEAAAEAWAACRPATKNEAGNLADELWRKRFGTTPVAKDDANRLEAARDIDVPQAEDDKTFFARHVDNRISLDHRSGKLEPARKIAAAPKEQRIVTDEFLQKMLASKLAEVTYSGIQPSNTLVVLNLDDGKMSIHALPQSGRVTVGRGDHADIRIDALSLSRVHAAIEIGSKIVVEDLASKNGTDILPRNIDADAPVSTVARPSVTRVIELRPGDRIRMGNVLAMVRRVNTSDPITAHHPIVAEALLTAALHEEVHIVASASTTAGVLIVGETGVGKEVLARTIHEASARAMKPFVVVNCAALIPTMAGVEFFGCKAGHFSGGSAGRSGWFETAEGGTLVLDGIEQLPLEFQAQLLRVLDHRAYTRIGESLSRPVNIRFIAITNENLAKAVASGHFREDLFYRLRGFELNVSPLRSRRAEIIPLARLFLEEESRAVGLTHVPDLSPEVVEILERYDWPGNVRELRTTMIRAVATSTGTIIEAEHVPNFRSSRPAKFDLDKPHRDAHAEEAKRIRDALIAHGGNLKAVATTLGVSNRTLFSRLNSYSDIPRPKKKSGPTEGSK